MLDKLAISDRLFSCHVNMSRSDIARYYGVSRVAVTKWATKGNVSWRKLKYLSDSQAICWDWLLEGIGPKESAKAAKNPRNTKPRFARSEINKRFLSLFPGMKQVEIASILDVTSGTVSEWKKNRSQVPWQKLEYVVAHFGVRWDWLIDGLKPKYR